MRHAEVAIDVLLGIPAFLIFFFFKQKTAYEMGFFVAGEGRRLYGRTTTSAMPNRTVMATRRPVGVAALIVSFNTPLPNYAWKTFPAVLCGNTAVLKPSEYTPASASLFASIANDILPS